MRCLSRHHLSTVPLDFDIARSHTHQRLFIVRIQNHLQPSLGRSRTSTVADRHRTARIRRLILVLQTAGRVHLKARLTARLHAAIGHHHLPRLADREADTVAVELGVPCDRALEVAVVGAGIAGRQRRRGLGDLRVGVGRGRGGGCRENLLRACGCGDAEGTATSAVVGGRVGASGLGVGRQDGRVDAVDRGGGSG